ERMARLVGHFRELLAAVAQDAERHLSRLELLTGAERGRLAQWNATDVPVPPGGVHELFEAQVAMRPGAVAVVSGGVALTYAGLDARANRLARCLAGRGVGAESVVGVCLPRGVDVVVAALAVWKAGGVYLPLDPEYPVQR